MSTNSHPHLRIIDDYLEGRLSVEAAAQEILATEAPPLNLSIGPRLRPLLAELHKLRTGDRPPSSPPFAADPNRHAGAGHDLLSNYATETLDHISKTPLDGKEFSLDCRIDAENKPAAERIAQWFRARGNYDIKIISPSDADSDDWSVHIATSTRRWDLASLTEWENTLRSAPLSPDSSIRALGY